jgi:WD40 repeat protein
LWQKYEHTSYPIRAAISPDGRLAATGSEGQVFVWSLENKGEQVCRLNTIKYEVNHLVFPNNNTLLVSGADGKNRFSIRLWDVVKCSELQVFRGGTDTTTRVAIAHDARTALSGKISGAVEHWDMTTGKTLQRLNGNQSGIFAIALTSDEKVVAAGDSDGRVVVWNLATGEKLQDKQLHRKKMTVFSMAFLGKQKLLSGSQDKKYVFWDYGSDNIESHSFVDSDSIFDIVTVVGVSDDHRLALAGGHGGELQLLNINDTGVKINKVSEENQTDAAAFVPGGKMFALAGPGPTIRLRDSVTTGLVKTFSGHTEPIRKISFSPDGKLLATASADQTVMLWDVASGAELGICRGHREAVVDVAFTKDSRYLLTSADWGEPEIIWDVPKCSLLVKRYSFFDGSWVMIDPEGRFDTNNLEELKGLHWIMPDDPQRPLPLEIFMRNYYTPKLYLKRINNTKFKDIQSLASLNRTQPKVEIIGIEREPGIDNLVTVKVKVTSLKSQVQKIDNNFLESGVYDLRLFRDGQMVWGWSTEPTNPDMTLERWREHYRIIDTGEMVITIPHIRLPQRQGVTQSTFTVYTYNNDQVKSETSPPFPWKIAPVAKPQPRYAYLITMATNANQSGWDLTLAVASAKLATDLWLNKLQPNYEVVPIVLESKTDANGVILPNVTATKAHLRTVLDVLAGREKSVPHDLRAAVDPTGKLRIATPDDAVIVYIASHGYVTPQGQFYVIPYDTGTQRGITEKLLTQCQQQPAGKSCAVAKNFLDHAISSEELSFWWHGVDAGELVLVLDTCFSAAVPGQDFRPGPLGDPGFGQLSYDKGMRILAATQPDKTARALARLGHTLLVEALKTASQGRQDQSIAEWFRATEHVLPQKVQLLYPELKENDLQLPELMDFASKKTIPKLTAQ